eukprot:806426-Pelagomonas_calceolata.AAC.3
MPAGHTRRLEEQLMRGPSLKVRRTHDLPGKMAEVPWSCCSLGCSRWQHKPERHMPLKKMRKFKLKKMPLKKMCRLKLKEMDKHASFERIDLASLDQTFVYHHSFRCINSASLDQSALALRAQHWVVILNMNYNDTADSVTQLLTTAQGLQDLLRARKLQLKGHANKTSCEGQQMSASHDPMTS